MVSSPSPHAGQLALSVRLILCRYPLSGKCCMRSWAIWLAAFLVSFALLIVLRNLMEGVVLSMRFVRFPLADCLQLSAHSFFSLSLCPRFIADGLLHRGFLRYGGRSLTWEEKLLAAFLASPSAFSFPAMPTWPAVHLSVSLNLRLFLRFCSWFARRRASRARWCPGFLSSESNTFNVTWLSTAIMHVVLLLFSVFIRCKANRSPTSSAS